MIKIAVLGSLAMLVLLMTMALCQIAGDESDLPCGRRCEDCPEKKECIFSKWKRTTANGPRG